MTLDRPSRPRRRSRAAGLLTLPLLAIAVLALVAPSRDGARTLLVGAVYPQIGEMGEAAADEELGVSIATQLVNADGGIAGARIRLDVRGLSTVDDAGPAVDRLKADGAQIVFGAYASELSMAASTAASDRGLLYWEAGAVADRITGRGLPHVFRVGATGGNLGANSALFAARQLAPRLGKSPDQLRVSLVVADDLYARSVADAAERDAAAAGMQLVSVSRYHLDEMHFDAVIADLRAARPDILVLSSHVGDGVAFRRAFLGAGLHVGAFIGSTMAECGPDFGSELGKDAIGVFASDRPGAGFDPTTLSGPAQATFQRFAATWTTQHGGAPSEEGIAGFSAAWALFHHVLPAAAARGDLTPDGIAAAARTADLPAGTLPDGGGLRFATDQANLGQNMRASAVIWQWQGVDHSVVVWPPTYATGTIHFVPLPR